MATTRSRTSPSFSSGHSSFNHPEVAPKSWLMATRKLTGHHRSAAIPTLPPAVQASNAEILRLLEDRQLWGRGSGWADLHLLASAMLSKCEFWTLEKRLVQAVKELSWNTTS